MFGASLRQYKFHIDTQLHIQQNIALLTDIEQQTAAVLNPNSSVNTTVNNENTVFVRNISYEATDKDVLNFFSSCGTVVKCSVPRDKTSGTSKGMCACCVCVMYCLCCVFCVVYLGRIRCFNSRLLWNTNDSAFNCV